MRPSSLAGSTSDALQPILALGTAAAGQSGLSATGCQTGQYALMVGQQGSVLRFDVRSAVYVERRRAWVCLQVEVDSARERGEIFSDPTTLHHVAVVVRPHEPLAVYVDGEHMPYLYLAANPLAEGDQPLDVQYADWSDDLRLLLSPSVAVEASARIAPSWDGSIHMVALYAIALSDAQIKANLAAFVRDSAPLAPDRVVNGTEDVPMVITLRGTDPFDAMYSPQGAATRIAVYIASLPREGTLHMPHAAGTPPPCSMIAAAVCAAVGDGQSLRRRALWPWKAHANGGAVGGDDGRVPCVFDSTCVDGGGDGRASCVGACRLCGYGSYAPCPPPPDQRAISRLPSRSRMITSADLPLLVPDGWLWYRPAPNAFSRVDPRTGESSAAAASFTYYASDGLQSSEPGTVQLVLNGVNDAPLPRSLSVDAYAGVPAVFELMASDPDSQLARATLVTTPRFGSLHEAPLSLSPAQAAQTPALSAGTELAAGRWRLVYVHRDGDANDERGARAESLRNDGTERAGGVPTTADDVLIRDQFAFGVCDADGACSASNASVELLVHNALGATSGETTMIEEVAGVVVLGGVDRRGSPLRFVVSRPPEVGHLYPCVPHPRQPPSLPPSPPPPPSRPPTVAAFVAGATTRDDAEALAAACCLEPSCLTRPIDAGKPLPSHGGGRLAVYRPPRDYYNCVSRGTRACAIDPSSSAATSAGATTLWFHVTDTDGRRSVDAAHKIWVINVNDPPRWTGTHNMSAEALKLTRLPDLAIEEADGDASEWEAQLQAAHGFLSLAPDALDGLSFVLGDGTSDHIMRLSGAPGAVLHALRGASYRAIDEAHNDTITIALADPRGSPMVTLGSLHVAVTPARTAATDVHGADAPAVDAAAVAGLWVVIGAVLLLCGVQIFGWLQRCCHPEAAELAANYRYLREQEAEDEDAAEKEAAAAAAAAAHGPGDGAAPRPPPPGGASATSGREVTIRQWALQQQQHRRRRSDPALVPRSMPSAADAPAAHTAASTVSPAMLAMVFKGRPHAAVDSGIAASAAATVAGAKVPPLAIPAHSMPASLSDGDGGGLDVLVSGRFGAAASARASPRYYDGGGGGGGGGGGECRTAGIAAATPATAARAAPRDEMPIEYSTPSDLDATAPTHPQQQQQQQLERRFSFPYRHRHGGEVVLKSDAGPLPRVPPGGSASASARRHPTDGVEEAAPAAGQDQAFGLARSAVEHEYRRAALYDH